jgi:hypothetical protein
MSEFGHKGFIAGGFCIDSWGAGPFVMIVGLKKYRFEDSDRFGPLIVNKDGREAAIQPAERSAFWAYHRAWKAQGRRIEDGLCKVDIFYGPPKPTKLRRVGRKLLVVENGDDGGAFVIEGMGAKG